MDLVLMFTVVHIPSRPERIGRASAYLFTAFIGFSSALFPNIQQETTDTLDTVGSLLWPWAAFMATAVPAAIATLYARHRIEYILLPLFTVALAAGVVAAWFTAQVDPTVMARASASSALVCLLVVRWMSLNRLNEVGKWTKTRRT